MTDTFPERPIQEIQAAWEPEADLWADIEKHPLMANSIRRKQAIQTTLTQFNQGLLKAERILDIGAGGGTHIYFPNALSRKVTAVDLSEAVLRLNPSALKILADARKTLPFAGESFDYVIQFFLNRYLEDQSIELGEIVRVLRTGGRFMIMDHSKFGHPNEVSEFNPALLQQSTLLSGFRNLEIIEISPAVNNPSASYYRGPLYLFTGIKP